jgi:amino acid transporter
MRRILSRLDVTCIGLNAIVGSGIFVLPDDLYRELGPWSPLAFLCCLAGLLPIAWCYAHAATQFAETGGPQVYARHTFGDTVGFAVGWMCFANSVFSFAAVASATAAYAGFLWPALAGPTWQKGVAAGVVLVFSALNYRGAKPGARAVILFTFGKFAVLIALVSVLSAQTNTEPVTPMTTSLNNWSQATFLALFAAQGFEVVPVPAGESRFPSRDIPFAVLSSLIGASLLYMVVQGVLVSSGANLNHVSDTPLADAAVAIAPALGVVVLAGGLISTLGFVSGSALGTPRYLYALAQSKQLPGALRNVHPAFESPHVAIVATAVAALACVIPFDYRSLIGMSNVAVAVQYCSTCLAVLRLSPTPSGCKRLLPWLGIAVSIWIVTEASRLELLWATISLVVGGIVVMGYRSATPTGSR